MKKAPSTTTQVSKVELPQWVDQASQDNYKLAQQISNQPLVQYQGPTVADPSQMTTQGYDLLQKNIGIADPMYQDAYNLEGRAASELDPKYQEAYDIQKSTAGPWNVDDYMNPYINDVENRTTANMQRSIDQSLMANSDKARAAGAFGGSRGAVQDAVLQSEGARGIGDMSATLRKQGYDTATANLIADRTSKQAAATGMLAGIGQQQKGWLDTASGLQSLGTARQDSMLKDVTGLMTAGQTEQAQRQKQIDADVAKFNEARSYPTEQLNMRLAALGMSPYGKTESVQKTGTSEQAGPDWATIGLGLMKLIPGISDRRDKTDIEKIGTSETTGLPLYAYRYKGDPKTYPKVVGPMAQDIEKKYPNMVEEVNGHKIVRALELLRT